MTFRRAHVAAAGAIALVTILLCNLTPLHAPGGDTVPGRFGAAVLRCGGGFDLRRVEYIDDLARVNKLPYWARQTDDGAVVSTFGPGPALLGLPVMYALDPGESVDDATLLRLARFSASLALGLSAALLVLAASATVSPVRAAVVGLVAAGSFAGAATLGQGLWQQTASLPLLAGALAALAWRERVPWIALGAPALLLAAVMLRPPMAPLAIGLGVAWCATAPRRWPPWAIASAAALALASPLIAWNLHYLGSPLPLGQWDANQAEAETVLTLDPRHVVPAFLGLLVSPARGLLWFAPLVLAGVALAARGDRFHRIVAGAIVAQILFTACFFKWWGGLGFGPRLIAETVWIAAWLALAPPIAPRRAVLASAAATVVVGQIGLWMWKFDQWEFPNHPDHHPDRVWWVVDSPLIAAITRHHADRLIDAPDERWLVCSDHGLSIAAQATGED